MAFTTDTELLDGGRLLPLVEDFYTIQGEGFHAGKPAYFIRLGGCDVGCRWCDAKYTWNPKLYPPTDVRTVIDRALACPAQAIVITGGEPLLHADMPEFLARVKELGYKIKLDTNGSNPELLSEIVKNKLVDRVAMDIKNAPEEYARTIGLKSFDIAPVERSKEMLLRGDIDYEFRTTVVKGIHTKESLIGAAKWIEGAKEYYLQQFKDSGNLILPDGLSAYDEKQMHALADAVRDYVPTVEVRGV